MRLADLEGRETCSVEEAAEILGINRSTAYRYAQSGELPSIQIGRRRLVIVARLRRMLEVDGSLAATDAVA